MACTTWRLISMVAALAILSVTVNRADAAGDDGDTKAAAAPKMKISNKMRAPRNDPAAYVELMSSSVKEFPNSMTASRRGY